MKLRPTTSLNDAIKRICDGDSGAATVISLLLKEYPDSVLDWLHIMDAKGMYGSAVWKLYNDRAGIVGSFIDALYRSNPTK